MPLLRWAVRRPSPSPSLCWPVCRPWPPDRTEHPGLGVGPTGTLGFHTGTGVAGGGTVLATVPEPAPGATTAPPADRLAGWAHATRVLTSSSDGRAYEAVLATTDPAGRTLDVRIAPDGGGVLQVTAAVSDPTGVDAVGVAFAAEDGERFLGFGERSNAVDQRGRTVERRRRRALPDRGAAVHLPLRAAVGLPPARRRHLLPDAVVLSPGATERSAPPPPAVTVVVEAPAPALAPPPVVQVADCEPDERPAP